MIHRRPMTAFLFLAPGLALYLLIVIYPLLQGFSLSTTNSKVGNPGKFIGAENYIDAFADPVVTGALLRTVLYAVVVVIVQNGVGLWLARALYYRFRVRRMASILVLLPTLMSAVMAAFVWTYLYARDGAINTMLRSVGLDSLTRVWLGDPSTSIWAIAVVNIWMFAGYSCAIFLAGYTGLPGELLDAARVDGASGWRKFANVEWPLLAPALTVNVTLSLIGSLKVFELPLVMTSGGPAGSSTTLSLLIYQQTFGGQGTFAYGTAIAIILLVVVVVLAAGTQTILRRREDLI
ncbi:carbohydrate ABC transporter permease [Arthrobacter sp. R4-81]